MKKHISMGEISSKNDSLKRLHCGCYCVMVWEGGLLFIDVQNLSSKKEVSQIWKRIIFFLSGKVKVIMVTFIFLLRKNKT